MDWVACRSSYWWTVLYEAGLGTRLANPQDFIYHLIVL